MMNSIFGGTPPQHTNQLSLKQRFNKLDNDRTLITQRWEDYAGFTLPHMFTYEHDATNEEEMQNDYQTVGARATNSLSNKINSNLFPQYRPFFRIDLTEKQERTLKAQGLEENEITELTARTERNSIKGLARENYSTASLKVTKSLIIMGNALLYNPSGKKAQVFHNRDWVIKRAVNGEWLEVIVREVQIMDSLPDELQHMATIGGITDPDHKLGVFTHVKRDIHTGRVQSYQELEDFGRIPNSEGEYGVDKNPWFPLTWNLARGRDYGTGLVEEYSGAFSQLSIYDETMANIAAIVSDIKILVNPLGQTNPEKLNEALPGEYVYGTPEDLAFHQLEKLADLNVIMAQREEIKREIYAAFLVQSGTTRDAERVTREEILRNAQELEESLGGIYSHLAETWQQPKAKRLLLDVDNALAKLEVFVLTGLEALSRTTEHEALIMTLQDMTILNELPETVLQRIKPDNIFATMAAGRGVEIKDIMMTEDEFESEQAKNAERNAVAVGSEAAAVNVAQQPQ